MPSVHGGEGVFYEGTARFLRGILSKGTEERSCNSGTIYD